MIDKSVNLPPVGGITGAPTPEAEAPSVEFEVELDDVDEESIFKNDEESEDEFNENLVEKLEEGVLATLISDLVADFDNDLASRADWEKTYADGLKFLGLKYEKRTEPWENACGAFSPILTEAVVRFQSEAIMELFPASGPVKTRIIGKRTKEKEDAAKRVIADLNYQLVDVMTEFRPEHEKMLWNLPIAGSAFKKAYFDPALGRQISLFVPAEDVVLPYGTSDISQAERVTHRMRKTKNEIIKLQQAGFYQDVDIGDPVNDIDEIQKRKDQETGFTATKDERYKLLEMHVELDLPGFEDKDEKGKNTGIKLPYVVTILKDCNKILAIYRNWKQEDENKLKREHFVHYQYIPGFGAYGFGLLHLIGSHAEASTSLLRQLVDSGTLANLPGGLKTRGLRMKGGDMPIAPGEFRDVDVPSGTVRDNIMPLPYKEPSQTLLALLDKITEDARKFAATADLKISDMSAQAPVGTTLALLERMLKVMSAVQARLHYSMKQELKLLVGIIKDFAEDIYAYEPEGEQGKRQARDEDFGMVEIIPVSDPNAATMSQRIVQYQAVFQLAERSPQFYDMPRLHRRMLETMNIPEADRLVPLPEDAKPVDPVTENMNIMRMKPVKAFAYQDHDAHLMVHMAFMQDPKIAATLGQNPQAQSMAAAIQSHIAEHAAFTYRAQIEQALGIPLPALDDEDSSPISAEDEKELAPLIAQAAQRTLTMNQAHQAQLQNQQAAQNPELILQQEELKLKAEEMKRKATNDDYDFKLGMARINLERDRMAADTQIKSANVAINKDKADKDRAVKARTDAMKIIAQANKPQPKKGN